MMNVNMMAAISAARKTPEFEQSKNFSAGNGKRGNKFGFNIKYTDEQREEMHTLSKAIGTTKAAEQLGFPHSTVCWYAGQYGRAPNPNTTNGKVLARRSRIMEVLSQGMKTSTQLSELLKVSSQTIIRDIATLQFSHEIKMVNGGYRGTEITLISVGKLEQSGN